MRHPVAFLLKWTGLATAFILAVILVGLTVRPRPATAHPQSPSISSRPINGSPKKLDPADFNCASIQVTNTLAEINDEPAINGDGTFIVFWSTANTLIPGGGSNEDSSAEIFLAKRPNPDSNVFTFQQVTVTNGNLLGGFNFSPQISRSGNRIVFISDDLLPVKNPQGNFEIVQFDLPSTSIFVTDSPKGFNLDPSLSSNGTFVAFVSDESYDPNIDNNDGTGEIFLANLSTGEFTQITHTPPAGSTSQGTNQSPSVSADGQRVAFSSNWDLTGNNSDENYEIFLYDSNTSLLQVTHTSSGNNIQSVLSDDGNAIAFVSDQEDQRNIFLYYGGNLKQITFGGFNEKPSINRDGSRIVFVSDQDLTGQNPDGNRELFLLQRVGHTIDDYRLIQLTDSTTGQVDAPMINTGGNHIVYTSDEISPTNPDGNREIFAFGCPVADLQVHKTVDNKTPNKGDVINYTITLSNTGPSAVANLRLEEEDLPVNSLTYLAHTTTMGEYDWSSHLWTITDTLAAGTEAILNLEMTVIADGVDVANRAGLLYPLEVMDPITANNTTGITSVVNAVPEIIDDDISTDEDLPINYDVAANDTDDDSGLNRASLTIESWPANGIVTVGAGPFSGTITYTPTQHYYGEDHLTYRLCDIADSCDTAAVTITVLSVNDPPTFTLPVLAKIVGEDDNSPLPGWATSISPGGAPYESSQILTFTVVGNSNPDLFADGPHIDPTSGDLSYTLAAHQWGEAVIDIILEDNGGTPNGGEDTSATQTFTLSVAAINDPPWFTPTHVIVDEGENVPNPITDIWGTDIGPGPPQATDEASQSITSTELISVVYTSSYFTDLFAPGGEPQIDATGQLTFTLADEDVNGTAVATVRLRDDQPDHHTLTRPFTITVNAINDPPSFTGGGDVSTTEDSGAQIVLGWATNISAGPPDEQDQTLNFAVDSPDLNLFSNIPAINANNGDLTYKPKPDANGIATIEVTLEDSAGESSSSQWFTITITPVDDKPEISLPGGALLYHAGPPAILLNSWAGVDDPDFASGVLTITSAFANDNLNIDNTVNVINVSGGGKVKYGGTEIGQASGRGTNELVITLNSNAIPSRIAALLETISFANVVDDPLIGQRSINFTLTDDTGLSGSAARTIDVNNPPKITLPPGPIEYSIYTSPFFVVDHVDTNVDDYEGNVAGGILKVEITKNGGWGDELSVAENSPIGVDGTIVSYSGTAIGTITQFGDRNDPLIVNLNENADAGRVDDLIRAVTFYAILPDKTRTVEFSLTDGEGGESDSEAIQVNVNW